MRTTLLITFFLLSFTYASLACSTCGCSAANQSIGLLSQIQNNFVGFQYQLRGFSTIHPDDGGTDLPGISHEYYQTFQVAGKYSLGDRVQFFAFVPYIINLRKQQNVSLLSMSGIGDITLLSNVYVIKRANCTWKHDLLFGGGMKLPTGIYDGQSTASEEGLPNMQPGTHSWDIIINGSYTVAHKAIGLNIDANYTITTANSDAYRYGNRFSANSFLFYKIKKRELTILPQLGASYDRMQKDYSNYSEKEIDQDSGSWQLYVSIGVQALYKHYGVQMKYQQPVSQHYNSGLVTNWNKTEAGIFLLF
jgi:hypothetical protein